jgi:PKD repeat protein
MAAPSIPSKQSFNIIVGTYFSDIISYSGTGPFTWLAVGLPDGLSIDINSGFISGTPTVIGNRSAYILLTNPEGNFATVVDFTIKEDKQNALSFSISPQIGYSKVTPYQFTTNVSQTLSSYSLLWSFGDGSISNEINPVHIYNLPGKYPITLNAYVSAGVISLSSILNVKLLMNESIYFEYVPPPTFAGHFNRYPFRVEYTSSKEGPHYIDIGSQFSRSYQAQIPANKWSFLRPQWRFLDINGNPIDILIPSETPIYCNELGVVDHDPSGLMVGVTGAAEFYFVDDIYNFDLFLKDQPYTTIIATLRTSGIRSFNDSFNLSDDLPSYSNSLATVATPYIFMYRTPDILRISENGIREHANPRWQEAEQPLIVAADYSEPYPEPFEWDDDSNGIKLYDREKAFAHYIPLSGSISLSLGATGISARFTPEPTQFQWIDSTGYKTPGYYKGSFFTNTVSSLNAIITASAMFNPPALSAQYLNPVLWISNPEAGRMATAQYNYNASLSAAITTPNLNIVQVHNFGMPIINQVDFVKDPMALSGIHGIYSIAAMPFPDYHAWALDSELNYLYRLTTSGDILCAIDVNQVVYDNQLGFLSPDQVSPASIVLDSKQNIWMTLHDTVSTLKFDRWGNFLFATTPLSSTGYLFPPAPNIAGPWYAQNAYYDYEESADYDWNRLNDVDLNFVEPNCVDTDSKDNAWVTYSHYASGYLVKYNSQGGMIYSHTYPVRSCPQQIVVDNKDNIWIALSNNIWDATQCTLEKRSSTGQLLSSVSPIRGLNHLTIDSNQNPWFTYSYSWIGTVDEDTGTIYTINLSGSNQTTNAADWLDPNYGNDETALEGIACDLKGRVYVINSIENQVYVIDGHQRKFLNKFFINPQGFTFYLEDQSSPTVMSASLWNKSLQASGDWSGLKWVNKYGSISLPFYKGDTFTVQITGQSKYLNFIKHEDYDIFKFNEDFDMAGQMKSLAFIPALNESNNLFENFLGSIYGTYPFKHNDLGIQTYEKIANYVSNHSDIDYCNINQLYDMAAEIGMDSDDFRLNFPPNIQRLVDYASINQSRLFGSRSLSQDAFINANNQSISNKGKVILSPDYVITAGTPVILKDKSLNKYRIIQTGEIYDNTSYSLYNLIVFLGLGDSWNEYYEFYEFVPSYDSKQVAGLIDWDNPQTTIIENLSTANFWFGEEQFLDLEFSYELYKGLGFI